LILDDKGGLGEE